MPAGAPGCDDARPGSRPTAGYARATVSTAPENPRPRDPGAKKGRPTPKRSEAERRRAVPLAPESTRAAVRAQREAAKAQRLKARAAMKSGDDRYLPARDAGPVRRHVRDLVDSRRNVGIIFLPAALFVFVGQLTGSPQVQSLVFSLWLGALLVLLVDSVRLGRLITRTTRQRFPEHPQRNRSLVFYGIARATVLRRFRLPAPAVKVGDPLR